jgi:hypothetical protein
MIMLPVGLRSTAKAMPDYGAGTLDKISRPLLWPSLSDCFKSKPEPGFGL